MEKEKMLNFAAHNTEINFLNNKKQKRSGNAFVFKNQLVMLFFKKKIKTLVSIIFDDDDKNETLPVINPQKAIDYNKNLPIPRIGERVFYENYFGTVIDVKYFVNDYLCFIQVVTKKDETSDFFEFVKIG